MQYCLEEVDFISLFECLPIKKDQNEVFWYDESTFIFSTETETFKIKISPFYNSLSLLVKDIDGEERFYYNLQTVKKIEIVQDHKEKKEIRLFVDQGGDRFITIIDIIFKPKFKVVLNEVFDS